MILEPKLPVLESKIMSNNQPLTKEQRQQLLIGALEEENQQQNEVSKAPFTIVVMDLLDANHYADVFDDWRYKVIGENFTHFVGCTEIADRLFWALNPKAKTQADWCESESGYDVHVYGSEASRLYRAHTKLPKE